MSTPDHYRPGTGATPWDLQRNMQSCGNLFADARRADAIKYSHRMKGDIIGDLEKAIHCLQEAVAELKKVHGDSHTPPTQQVQCMKDKRYELYKPSAPSDKYYIRETNLGLFRIINTVTGDPAGEYASKGLAKKRLERMNQDLQTSEPVISSPPNPA